MKRRSFIALASAMPIGFALAQAMPGPKRIAMMRAGSPSDGAFTVQAFREGLRDQGLVEGRDFLLDVRWAIGDDAYAKFAAELAQWQPAVFAVGGTIAAHAARAAAPTVPIVALIGDFSMAGWAAEFGRPGVGVTGISFLSSSLDPKRLELLADLLPRGSAVLNLGSGSVANVEPSALEAAARMRGLVSHMAEARSPAEIDAAFETARRLRVHGINVLSSPFLNGYRKRIIGLAAQARLPAIYQWAETAAEGGLMAYGPRLGAAYRRLGVFAGKIANGTPLAQLPVEQPTKFELVINMKTAKALGIAIPQPLLLRADEVIR